MWSWSFWHNSNRVILWMLLCSEKILLQGEEDENHKIHFTLKMEPSFTYSYQWAKSKTTNEISINILWNFPFFGHRKITFVQVRDWSRWRCVIWNWQPSSWHSPPLLFTLDNISRLQTAITHKISTQTAIYQQKRN